jgi:CRISPR-associated protein Csm5
MTIYRFTAQALTPLHVGCGAEIDPTGFVLKEGRLVHFNPAQVIADLSGQERDRFIEISERADLKEIQNFLRAKVDVQRHGLARIESCESFQREFGTKSAKPGNQFRVEMMPRSAHTARAYLPGSGIKGAIRTAVVNHFANHVAAFKAQVHEAVNAEPGAERKARLLEEKSLNRRHSETERDLFRLIHVQDAVLPDGATRIDRAANFNPAKSGSENIQMWVERVKSMADTPDPPAFKITVRIDDRAMSNAKVRQILGRTLGIEELMQACNRFYWKRMQAEGDAFDGRQSESSGWRAIHDCFPKGRLDGRIVPVDPAQSFWNNRAYGMHYVLLRVGRFSHFESLSVDGLRQGFNVKTLKPIIGMGATRTRCMMENHKPPMPFGWLLLRLEGSL